MDDEKVMPETYALRLAALYRRRSAILEVIAALEEYQRAAESSPAPRLVVVRRTACRERAARRVRRTARASIARR